MDNTLVGRIPIQCRPFNFPPAYRRLSQSLIQIGLFMHWKSLSEKEKWIPFLQSPCPKLFAKNKTKHLSPLNKTVPTFSMQFPHIWQLKKWAFEALLHSLVKSKKKWKFQSSDFACLAHAQWPMIFLKATTFRQVSISAFRCLHHYPIMLADLKLSKICSGKGTSEMQCLVMIWGFQSRAEFTLCV